MKRFFLIKKKKQQQPEENQSLTLYLTEEDAADFSSNGQFLPEENDTLSLGVYGRRLQWGSDILAIMISCLLVGSCYLQWQTPPQVLQYEQEPGQLVNPEQPLAVDVENDGLFASLTIEVSDYDSLEQAYLLVNGAVSGSFHGKQLVVRVYPGDVLEIDTSAYLSPCRFQIIKKSSHIREETMETLITTENGYGWVGKISFK